MTTLNKKNTKQLEALRKRINSLTELVNQLNTEIQNFEQNAGKGRKTTKDPNAPKRPSTAWIFYYKEQIQVMKKKNTDMSTKEICSALGAKWKKMSDRQKKKYNDLAQKDRERYQREKDAYEAKNKATATATTTTAKTTTTTKKKPPVDDSDLVLDDDDDFEASDLNLSDDGDF